MNLKSVFFLMNVEEITADNVICKIKSMQQWYFHLKMTKNLKINKKIAKFQCYQAQIKQRFWLFHELLAIMYSRLF